MTLVRFGDRGWRLGHLPRVWGLAYAHKGCTGCDQPYSAGGTRAAHATPPAVLIGVLASARPLTFRIYFFLYDASNTGSTRGHLASVQHFTRCSKIHLHQHSIRGTDDFKPITAFGRR